MKNSFYKLLTWALVCVATIMTGACSQDASKKASAKALMPLAPKDSSLVVYVNPSHSSELLKERPDFQKLLTAIKENKIIQDFFKEGLNGLSENEKKELAPFISFDDPVSSISTICLDTVDSLLIYAKFDKNGEDIDKESSAIVVRIKDATFTEKLNNFFKNKKEVRSLANNMYAVEEAFIAVNKDVVVVTGSESSLKAVLASIEKPAKESVLDSEEFKKLIKDPYKQDAVIFVSAESLPQTPDLSVFKQMVSAISFVSNGDINNGTAELNVIFKDSKVINMFKSAKISEANKVCAVQNAQAYVNIGFAIPEELKATIPPAFTNIINNIKSIEMSVNGVENANAIQMGVLPEAMINITVEDADKLLSDPMLQSQIGAMFPSKNTIDGTECYVSPMGVYIAKISKNKISVISTKNVEQGVKIAKGKNAEQADFLKSFKVPSNTALKFYYDALAFNKLTMSMPMYTQNMPDGVPEFLALYMKSIKKSQLRGFLQENGDILQLKLEATNDIDFTPLTDFVKNLK